MKGFGLGVGDKGGLLWLREEVWGPARHDDEGSFVLLIRLDGVPAIEPCISSRVNFAHAAGHGGKHGLEMARDLRPGGSVSVASLPADICPGVGDKGKTGQVTLRPFVLLVVSLARLH